MPEENDSLHVKNQHVGKKDPFFSTFLFSMWRGMSDQCEGTQKTCFQAEYGRFHKTLSPH